ncbi:hypothetical protein CA606_08215 [Caulobacter vibrioides]|uniref:Uncharacterized protein n=1 Tax=Caulobacter vibrioides TaxID=155892 RepID=A0A290MK14_CAUVI|nr:DUF6702 family protein [Caulobacter vibrioides]ATC32338.1 hypothetical protein CA606_08215 [Caulobacter vibrioides]
MIRRAVALLAAASFALAPLPAAAHRGHGALSVVEIDVRSGEVRVSHRIATHDAEPALALIAPEAQTSLDDPDAVEALKLYMGKRFVLAVADQLVALTLKDMTLGADEVRFEYAGKVVSAQTRAEVAVIAAMFADVYGDQVNQVNIRRAGVTRTLVFTGAEAETPQALAPIEPAQ